MEEVQLYFVIPSGCADENDCSEDMQDAFLTCEQHRSSGFRARWVRETECPELDSLTKRDVFVLSEFKGEFFEKLQHTKCLVIGPRCLSCCWSEGWEIPAGPEPVFTVAMRGVKVTASGFPKSVKESIKEKVIWMGGVYNDALRDDTTHLVCDTVLSDKYCIAVEKGLPIMSHTWVEAVWESSTKMNVTASSAQFAVHRLSVFSKLQVTCSSLGRKEKETIMKLINSNGGTFTGAFNSDSTDIVVLNKSGLGGSKHKAAQEYGKSCVLPAWVTASVERGRALPPRLYRVSGASTSSPLAGNRPPDMSLNFSTITNLRPPSNFVDETQHTDCSVMNSGRLKMSQESKKSDEQNSLEKDIAAAIDNFDMSKVKQAGPVFDGFCIYVCGLEGARRERVCALVSRAGGVRYDEPHERVTHAVAGTRAAAAAARAALPAAPVISPLWLTHSIDARKILSEREYLIDEKSSTVAKRVPSVEPSSPMSKRNLQLLRPGAPGGAAGAVQRPPVPKFDLDPPPTDDESIVQQYLAAAADNDNTLVKEVETKSVTAPTVISEVTGSRKDSKDKDNNETDCTDDPTEDMEEIFAGIRLELQCVEESSVEVIAREVERAGGRVVSCGSGGEYVLVPLDFDTDDLVSREAHVVTVFWLKDCLSQRSLLPLQYYHRPVSVWEGGAGAAGEALAGVVLSISTYTGIERMFLDELAQLLGATTQMRFCRRTTPTSRASTHLLCPEPRGDKYTGAVKWGLPAVSGEWLLACAAAGRRVREGPFVVGDTKAPEWKDSIEESVESGTDKENEVTAMAPPPEAVAPPKRPSTASKEDTPLKKIQAISANMEGDMSPASRYIAMARQGLLGTDSQETPKRVSELRRDSINPEVNMKTPPLEEALATPNLKCLSPTTRRRLQAIKRGEMPSDPIRTPNNPFETGVVTPDSGFGAALRPQAGRMSPESRKQLWTLVQDLPGAPDPPPAQKKDTPFSEVCNRFLSRYNPSAPPARRLDINERETPPPSKIAKTAASLAVSGSSSENSSLAGMDKQLQQLNSLLEAQSSRMRRSSTTQRPATPMHLLEPPEIERTSGPDSQVNTVGWDDSSQLKLVTSSVIDNAPLPPPSPPPPPKPKIFMLSSNVENGEELGSMIMSLGGEVRCGEGVEGEVTHVLCAAPSRSERVLCSVAAGKWLLHPSYVARSHAAGTFLQEDEFEWGNDAALVLPTLDAGVAWLARSAHRWRSARAAGRPGPFHDMRAVLHMPVARRATLVRLLVAGGAAVVDNRPPYSCADATHCFADTRKCPMEQRDLRYFVERGIPVCAPIFITSYLEEERPCPRSNCLPEYQLIYNQMHGAS